MVDKTTINMKMHELEGIIEYTFNQVSYLCDAMFAKKINDSTSGKNNNEHANDALATVGDCILKAILAAEIYSKERPRRGHITIEKRELENNDVLFDVANKYGIINFAYHETHFFLEAPEHLCVANSQHNQYIEAIVAAIYFDQGFDAVKNWVLTWLKPKLENYQTLK